MLEFCRVCVGTHALYNIARSGVPTQKLGYHNNTEIISYADDLALILGLNRKIDIGSMPSLSGLRNFCASWVGPSMREKHRRF